jgi:hypothetical protein
MFGRGDASEPMSNIVFLKQEAGRKRIAKLLGIAPYRVELTFDLSGVAIEIDGKPATDEQLKVFWDDVAATVAKFRPLPN